MNRTCDFAYAFIWQRNNPFYQSIMIMKNTRCSARAPQRGAARRCLESFDIFSRVATFCEARQSTSNLISMFSSLDFKISSRFGINVFESVYKKFKNFIDFSRLEFQDSTFTFGLVKGIQTLLWSWGTKNLETVFQSSKNNPKWIQIVLVHFHFKWNFWKISIEKVIL